MFRRRYGSRPRKFSRRPRRAIRRRAKVSKKIRSYVKKAIHRNIENKEIIDYFSNAYIVTQSGAASNTGTGCRQLLPLPAQGTQDNQRIGNAIRVVKGVIKGHINILPYDATYNPLSTPVLVKIWLFKDMYVQGTQNITGLPTFFDGFFRGNATPLPFQGNPLDAHLPIDDTHFRLLATKTFTIGATYASAVGAVGTGGYFDNSKMSVPFYFNWGKYCKKMIKFTDGGAYPTNDNMYIVVQPLQANGAASGTNRLVEWHAVNHIKYEDA